MHLFMCDGSGQSMDESAQKRSGYKKKIGKFMSSQK